MHAHVVVPEEERLAGLLRVVAVKPVDGRGRNLLGEGLGPFQRDWTFVPAGLALETAVLGGARYEQTRRRQAGRGLGIDRAGHLLYAGDRRVLARRRDSLIGRRLVDVGETHLLDGIQVVEIAQVLLEPVRGRQRLGVVAQVVLAELPGGVTQIEQHLGQRRRALAQPCRAAGKLRHGQTNANRVHAGEERRPAGGAALHGGIVHEDSAFLGDPVDVRRFADHPAAVVDLRLHQADVVAHDEQDIGFLAAAGGGSGAGARRGHNEFLADLDHVRRQLVLRLQRVHGNLETLADRNQIVTLDHSIGGGGGIVLALGVFTLALVCGRGSADAGCQGDNGASGFEPHSAEHFQK